MTNIPGINYNIRQSLNRLQLQSDIYNEEFVQRLQLAMGHPDYFSNTAYGIVAQIDPATATPGATDVPLVVDVNSTDSQTIDVSPGLCVTRSGMWIQLDAYARQVGLADPSVGVSNVVYLRYLLEMGEPQLNDYYTEIIPTRIRPGGVGSVNPTSIQVSVDTLESWLAYSQDIRDDFVPLAVVTQQAVQDPLTLTISYALSIDHTQGSYGWNRPWFSVQDTVHRNQVGSGIVTASNAHGLGQNDLTVGDFSPLQLQLDHGMIVANDKSIPKIPGVRCEVSIPFAAIKIDDATGSNTSIPNAQYIELPNYPVRLGRCWVNSSNVDWAAEIVKETNRIVLPFPLPGVTPAPPINDSLDIFYTKVVACEPTTAVNDVTFTTNNPDEEELVIAGGYGLTTLGNTQEPMADAQRFPMVYDILVDGEGDLIKTPQVIYCHKRLEALGMSDDISISLYGPGRVICGLTGATAGVGLSVKIRLYGKDQTGAPIDHLFEFGAGWSEPLIPVPQEQITTASYLVSSEIFYEVDQVVVEERLLDGLNSAIMLWSAQNPVDTYEQLKDACHVARVFWNGIGMSSIRDKRIISTTVRDFLLDSSGNESFMFLVNAIGGGNTTIVMEDFFSPRYHNLVPNTELGTLDAILPANNMERLRPGIEGRYNTRALAVRAGSGTLWRVTLTPIQQTKNIFDYYPPASLDIPNNCPRLWYYAGGMWIWITMTPVLGMYNMYEVTLPAVPDMVRVEMVASDYHGMLLFG